MKPLYPWLLPVAMAALLLASGCVHQEITRSPKDDSTLTITRAGDAVQLGWRSRPDRIYTVVYSERLGGGAVWQALPAATMVKGTGGLMNISDSVPDGRARYYRLQIQRSEVRSQRSD